MPENIEMWPAPEGVDIELPPGGEFAGAAQGEGLAIQVQGPAYADPFQGLVMNYAGGVAGGGGGGGNGLVGHMWHAVPLDDYLAAAKATKKPFKIKPTVEGAPLELNLAAKKASPFTKLTNLEEVLDAREAGKYLEYIPFPGADQQGLSPINKYTNDVLLKLLKKGIFAHDTMKVLVVVPCKAPWGGHMWTGPSIWAWLDWKEDHGIDVVFATPSYFVYEGTTFNV